MRRTGSDSGRNCRRSLERSTKPGGTRLGCEDPVVSTMAAKGSRSLARLNEVDGRGRKIEPAVLAAAERIYPRVLRHGLKLLGDPALVTDALEEVAAAVSRMLRASCPADKAMPVHDLHLYIFRGFLRHVNRLKCREVEVISLGEVADLTMLPRVDPTRQIETKILLDECLAQCDFLAQDMAWRRSIGFSWEEIGEIHGLSAHAAEARFSYSLRKAKERLKI